MQTNHTRHFFWILLLLLTACTYAPTGEPESVIERLAKADQLLVSVTTSLNEGLKTGVFSPDDPNVHKVRDGLRKFDEILTAAFTAYESGDVEGADVMRRMAMAVYAQIRPYILSMALEEEQ